MRHQCGCCDARHILLAYKNPLLPKGLSICHVEYSACLLPFLVAHDHVCVQTLCPVACIQRVHTSKSLAKPAEQPALQASKLVQLSVVEYVNDTCTPFYCPVFMRLFDGALVCKCWPPEPLAHCKLLPLPYRLKVERLIMLIWFMCCWTSFSSKCLLHSPSLGQILNYFICFAVLVVTWMYTNTYLKSIYIYVQNLAHEQQRMRRQC